MNFSDNRLLVLLVLLLLIRFAVVPLVGWQSELVVSTSANLQQIWDRRSVASQLSPLQSDIAVLEDELVSARSKAFPKGATATVAIQADLADSLQKQGITLTSFEWGPLSEADPAVTQATIGVTGEITALVNWHEELLRRAKWMTVESMTIRRASTRRAEAKIFVGTFNLKVVFRGSGDV